MYKIKYTKELVASNNGNMHKEEKIVIRFYANWKTTHMFTFDVEDMDIKSKLNEFVAYIIKRLGALNYDLTPEEETAFEFELGLVLENI